MAGVEADWFLTAQYVVANASNVAELKAKLPKLGPFVDVKHLIQLLLVFVPLHLSTPDLGDVFDQLVDNRAVPNDDEYFDVQSLFSDMPEMLSLQLGGSDEQKSQYVTESIKYMQDYCYKYGWDDKEPDLRGQFFKTLILKLNDLSKSFDLTDKIVEQVTDLPDWKSQFYYPLNSFSRWQNGYTLHDYQSLLPAQEQVDMILDSFVGSNYSDDIILKTWIPYSEFLGIDSWSYFNTWFKSLGEKLLKPNKNAKFETILQFIRQDKLLISLNKIDESLRVEFVNILISIILLNPSNSLENLNYSKEILILIKSLSLPTRMEEIDLNFLKSSISLNDTLGKINSSIHLINYILKVIEISEILSSNELSFIEIINLENNDHQSQLRELQKFINIEATQLNSNKSWSITLSSIYRILKISNVFRTITPNELSLLILNKLLDLKKFDFINKEFSAKFNTLPQAETESIILNHSWDLYKSASNCDPKIGNLKHCLNCLSLLNGEDIEVSRLKSLIDANEMILNWKLYFKSGVPFKPNDILEINDPMAIITRILDLNDSSYKSIDKLYNLLSLLVIGLNLQNQSGLFRFSKEEFTNEQNLLSLKLKLISLDYSSTIDMPYSYKLANSLLNSSLKYEANSEMVEIIQKNWIVFFTMSKFSYNDEIESDDSDNEQLNLLKDRINLLSKLILFTPADFNIQVLEYWQMLNSQYDHFIDQQDSKRDASNGDSDDSNVGGITGSNMGDLKNRLQRSLASATETAVAVTDTDTNDIGRNIVGWIIGAN